MIMSVLRDHVLKNNLFILLIKLKQFILLIYNDG